MLKLPVLSLTHLAAEVSHPWGLQLPPMGEIGGDNGILRMITIDIIESIKQDNILSIKKLCYL